MKANEAPEKIYFSQTEDGRQYFTPAIPFEREFVEYMTVDAFIEKAWDWFKENKEAIAVLGFIPDYYIEDFRKYMEGE